VTRTLIQNATLLDPESATRWFDQGVFVEDERIMKGGQIYRDLD
jgi:hypothetical protein